MKREHSTLWIAAMPGRLARRALTIGISREADNDTSN